MVILAGGSSRRFQGDKLTAPMGGQTVLGRTVASVAPLASEVVIATTTEARRARLARAVPGSVRFLLDRPGSWGTGPAAAIASAREELRVGPALFVPGDTPWLETEALARFVHRAKDGRVEVAGPYWSSGETEHLIQWHRGPETLRPLPWQEPHASPVRRASEFLRAAPRTLLVPIAELSARPESFSHVTYRPDLVSPSPRGRTSATATVREVDGFPKGRYRAAHTARSAGEDAAAADAFLEESRWYEEAGLGLLARHCWDDARLSAPGDPAVEAVRTRLDRRFPMLRHGPETVNRRRATARVDGRVREMR